MAISEQWRAWFLTPAFNLCSRRHYDVDGVDRSDNFGRLRAMQRKPTWQAEVSIG